MYWILLHNGGDPHDPSDYQPRHLHLTKEAAMAEGQELEDKGFENVPPGGPLNWEGDCLQAVRKNSEWNEWWTVVPVSLPDLGKHVHVGPACHPGADWKAEYMSGLIELQCAVCKEPALLLEMAQDDEQNDLRRAMVPQADLGFSISPAVIKRFREFLEEQSLPMQTNDAQVYHDAWVLRDDTVYLTKYHQGWLDGFLAMVNPK